MRKIISIGAILLAVFIILLGGNYFFAQTSNDKQDESEIIEEDEHFRVIYDGDSQYHYMIYNKDKEIVREADQYGTIPSIKYIDEKTIQISISAGTATFTCMYYDISEDKFSPLYISPVAVEYGKIAYVDHNKTPFMLVVSDIYDKNVFFKEFDLDMSASVAPIIKAEFLDEDNLFIVYTSGELFEEISTELKLD